MVMKLKYKILFVATIILLANLYFVGEIYLLEKLNQKPVFTGVVNSIDYSLYCYGFLMASVSDLVIFVTSIVCFEKLVIKGKLALYLLSLLLTYSLSTLLLYWLKRMTLIVFNLPLNDFEVSDKMLLYFDRIDRQDSILLIMFSILLLGIATGFIIDWFAKNRSNKLLVIKNTL